MPPPNATCTFSLGVLFSGRLFLGQTVLLPEETFISGPRFQAGKRQFLVSQQRDQFGWEAKPATFSIQLIINLGVLEIFSLV